MHATKVVSILPPRLNQLAWSFGFVYDTVGGEGSKHGELGQVLGYHDTFRRFLELGAITSY